VLEKKTVSSGTQGIKFLTDDIEGSSFLSMTQRNRENFQWHTGILFIICVPCITLAAFMGRRFSFCYHHTSRSFPTIANIENHSYLLSMWKTYWPTQVPHHTHDSDFYVVM
jgi:hypothetical protein